LSRKGRLNRTEETEAEDQKTSPIRPNVSHQKTRERKDGCVDHGRLGGKFNFSRLRRLLLVGGPRIPPIKLEGA